MKTLFARLILLLMLLTSPALAQWEYGGRQIGYGPIDAWGVQLVMAPDDRGGVYVAWKGLSPSRTRPGIVINHFDTAGVALFGSEGLWITGDSVNVYYGLPAIAPDGFGGCYLMWSDYRDYTDGRGSFYAQRVTYEGTPLWGNGVRMIYTEGSPAGYMPRSTAIYADSALGMIGVCKIVSAGRKSLLAQRIDEWGNLTWDTLGTTLRIDSTELRGIALIKSMDNLYCVWQDGRGGIQTYGDIYAQKLDASGNIYWGLGGLAVAMNRWNDGDPLNPTSIQAVPDGTGGVVVGWVYALHPGHTLRADRISPSGQSLWQINGRTLLPGEQSSRDGLGLHAIGEDTVPTFLAVVLGGYQANYQIVDLSGNLLLGDSGDTLSEESFFASAEYADTLYFMPRIGNYYFGSKKDAAGNEYWPDVPYIHGLMGTWEMMADQLGGVYVAFTIYKDFYNDWVYIQRIYPDGHVGGDTTTAVHEIDDAKLPISIFNLSNYPNPFNSSTVISFDMQSGGMAYMCIYDALGRKIDSLNLGQLNAGRHIIEWNFEKRNLNVSSGIYIISLQIDQLTETKRMVVLK